MYMYVHNYRHNNTIIILLQALCDCTGVLIKIVNSDRKTGQIFRHKSIIYTYVGVRTLIMSGLESCIYVKMKHVQI